LAYPTGYIARKYEDTNAGGGGNLTKDRDFGGKIDTNGGRQPGVF